MNKNIDLTVATNILMADGIGRQGIGLIDLLKKDLKINVLRFPPSKFHDIPPDILPIVSKNFDAFGKVLFWTYILGINDNITQFHKIADSQVKIAYTMFESSLIPDLWVNILNSYYDMVVVPDPWLIQVYQNSGVKVPIFVLPLGILIENLLSKPIKTEANKVFTFGMTGGFYTRKNHLKVLEAFASKFGNNPNYQLKMHGRFGPQSAEIQKAFRDANLNNIKLYVGPMTSEEYTSFMTSLDCYVFVSQGEGFSITPRESLALGIPCILSDNTVHSTICQTGLTVNVKADLKKPAQYEVFGNKNIGYFYDCQVEDVAHAMEYVAYNYDKCLEQVKPGREWVSQYLWSALKSKYVSLFKPKSVTLGNCNQILEDGIVTSDKKLFEKYKKIT